MRQGPVRNSVITMERRGKVPNAVFKHKTLFDCFLKYIFSPKLMRIRNCAKQYCNGRLLQETEIHFTQIGFIAFQNVSGTIAHI